MDSVELYFLYIDVEGNMTAEVGKTMVFNQFHVSAVGYTLQLIVCPKCGLRKA